MRDQASRFGPSTGSFGVVVGATLAELDGDLDSLGGPILAPGREDEVARVLADAVVRLPGWDVLMLTDMNPDCPFTPAVAAAARSVTLSARPWAERG